VLLQSYRIRKQGRGKSADIVNVWSVVYATNKP
jgi:hypothetical protein